MEIHPSQRRVSCELCRKNKAKCQRLQPDDAKCVRCTLANAICDAGEQKKVGRPKRTAVESSRARKRPKQATAPWSRSTANTQLKDCAEPPSQYVSDITVMYGTPGRTESEPAGASFPTASASVSTSIPVTRDFEPLLWPSFVTDAWCHGRFSGVARTSIFPEPGEGSAQYANAGQSTVPLPRDTPRGPVYAPRFGLPDPSDQDVSQSSSPSVIPDSRTNSPNLFSNYRRTQESFALPFGIGRPAAYYVHENQFSSDPITAFLKDSDTNGPRAMVRLTHIVYGLRLRSTMVQTCRSKMNLSLLIHRQGPLFIGSYSLAEYVMDVAQELVHIATSLIEARSMHRSDDHISTCVVSAITNVYCRILSFFQLLLEHLTDRTERLATDPVVPIPGLKFNGIVLTGPCTQGTLFCSSVYYLLERLENVLGFDSMYGKGLFSVEQIDVLCNKLDETDDMAQSKGIMRPADMRKLYAQVATVLERISIAE